MDDAKTKAEIVEMLTIQNGAELFDGMVIDGQPFTITKFVDTLFMLAGEPALITSEQFNAAMHESRQYWNDRVARKLN